MALNDYIHTRRWTTHKFVYEVFKRGTPLGAVVSSEHLSSASGPLFVPNIDLCAPEEIEAIARYRGGAVVMTAPVGFDPNRYGIQSGACFIDPDSRFPMAAFTYGAALPDGLVRELGALLTVKDDSKDLEGDPLDAPEYPYTLMDTLSFSKVSDGFVRILARMLRAVCEAAGPLSTDVPYAAYKLKNGDYRMYLYNTLEDIYGHAHVNAKVPVKNVKIVSKYPILPVRFVGTNAFWTKLEPAGVTIIDITL